MLPELSWRQAQALPLLCEAEGEKTGGEGQLLTISREVPAAHQAVYLQEVPTTLFTDWMYFYPIPPIRGKFLFTQIVPFSVYSLVAPTRD